MKRLLAFLATALLSTCATMPSEPGDYAWPIDDFWIIEGEETLYCKQVESAVICL